MAVAAADDQKAGVVFHRLARFPLAWNHTSDEKARSFKKLERILFAKVYQLLRNAL